MTPKDFFEEYPEPTKIKIDLFRLYTRNWLPTFLAQSRDLFPNQRGRYREINIFDFFAGKGKDDKGAYGSPLVILEELEKFYQGRADLARNIPIRLFFNEKQSNRYKSLRQNVDSFDLPTIRKANVDLKIESSHMEFRELWEQKRLNLMDRSIPCLLIIDQFGIKEVDEGIFSQLINLPKTDVIFFVSSAYIKRFRTTPEFKRHFPSLDLEDLRNVDNVEIHNAVCRKYRELASKYKGGKYYLVPFTLKNGTNYYGVIFGTSHLLGVEKFLDVAWKLDKESGESSANILAQPSLFDVVDETLPPTPKVNNFIKNLLAFIRLRQPSNVELYRFCLEQGFSIKKSNEILNELKKKGQIQSLTQDGKSARSFYLEWKYCNQPTKIKVTALE